MRSQKAHKIDLSNEYPCPCRRRGSLIPITLTEAFGCNRCQRIFVVEESGYVMEELSTTYPYKKWRWTGYRWITGHNSLSELYLPVAFTLVIILPIFWLVIALSKDKPTPLLVLTVLLLLMVGVPLWTWLAYRR